MMDVDHHALQKAGEKFAEIWKAVSLNQAFILFFIFLHSSNTLSRSNNFNIVLHFLSTQFSTRAESILMHEGESLF